MSSNDFQTQYSSFMENMLKSAVAETTKLYETMVDELKEEISRIKKENEDLRTKCRQFENAKNQPADHHRENDPLPEQSDDSEKCDTAVQCDIVSFRTILVEQCQPLGHSSLKNQQLLYAGESIGCGLQEQGGTSQMTLILVKQEESENDISQQPVVKQEEVESAIGSENFDDSSSLHISLNGTENEGALINHEGSKVETTSSQKDGEVPERPCLGINGSSEGAQSHTSDPIVISLAVLKDDIKEESEVHEEISEGEMQVPQQCQTDGERATNEQTVFTAQPCAEEQLAESIPINKEVACEEIKKSLAEDETTSQTDLSICCGRGQPPEKMKQKEILGSSSLDVLKGQKGLNTPSVREEGVSALSAVDTVKISSTSPRSSSVQPNVPSSIVSSSVQEMAKIVLQDMDNRPGGSLPASVLSLSGGSSSEMSKSPETQQLHTDVEKVAIQAPSIQVLSAGKTLNVPLLESTQVTPGQHKQRRTSVTLQDAMLLVEAMNQSTLGSIFTGSHKMSPPQTHSAPRADALQTVDAIPAEPRTLPVKSQFTVATNEAPIAFVTPKQQHVSSNAQTRHPPTPRKLSINKSKIIVVPRVGSSHNKIASATEKGSTTESTAAHNSLLTPSSLAGLPLKTLSLPCPPKKTDSTSMKSLPNSQLSKPSADQQPGGPPRKKITIIVSRRVLVERPSTHQSETTVVTAVQEATAPHDVPVIGTSGQSTSTSQELSGLASNDTALHQKSENATDNLESPKQTACVMESAPTDTRTSLKQPVKIMPTSVFPAVQAAAEQRCPAVVEVTKVPFSESHNTSGTMQEKSSKPAVPDTPVTSSNSSLNLTETPIDLSLNTPEESEESNNIQERAPLTSETFTLREAPACLQPSAPVTSVEPTPSLDSSEVQENAIIQLTSMAKEASDPHLQMTKTQFLAQLAVSPIVQEPAKKANSGSLVTRLRRHLKNHLEARRAETKPEEKSESKVTTVSSKKHGVENGSLNDQTTTEETSPITPKKTADGGDADGGDADGGDADGGDADGGDADTSLRMISNAPSSVSPVGSGVFNADDSHEMTENEPTSVTSRSCKTTSDSTLMCPRMDITHRDGVGTEHTEYESPKECNLRKETVSPENISVSPRRSSDRDGDCPTNKKSKSMSLRRSASGRDGDCPENKKSRSMSLRSASGRDGDCPENKKSRSMSLRSASGRDGDCPKNKKSRSMSVRRSASGGGVDSNNKMSGSLSSRSPSLNKESGSPKITTNNASPRNTKSSTIGPVRSPREAVSPRTSRLSQSGTCRSLVFNKDDSGTKRIKRESSSSMRSEFSSPSAKFPAIAENGISPPGTETSTPAKKPKLIQGVISPKRGFKIVSVTKLAKASNTKKMAKMKKSNKSKLQTTRLSKNQRNCEVVKKCKAKVWIPPVMTESEMPPAGKKKACLSPDASSQTKLVKSPIVSPLQPLAVIGRFLLRNQCGECGRILSSSAALESHVSLHTGHRPFSCTFCGKSFPDDKSFKRHGRVHRNGPIHICKQCGKGFVYRFGLTKHVQMVHGRIKPFICQICSKGFFTKRDVEAHIRIHTGEKPFQCTLCERRFTRKVELNVHLRWHNGEKRHWCSYCGKGFLDYNNLKRHNYTHTGEKPHSCEVCSKKFTQKAHLNKHLQNVHHIK